MPTIGVNEFVKRQTRESKFSHYDGAWEDLATEVMANWKNAKPGYRDGVVLVPLAPEKFFSGVVQVEDGVELSAQLTRRRPNEEPYLEVLARKARKLPAKAVEIVCYRKDVLEKDGDPVSGADWDIISVNASPEGATPMDPVTMMRNFLELPGGTKGVYTAEEFARSIRFWSTHVMIDPT